MPIVSNTSPILNLAIVNALDFLRQQFARVLIPSAVMDELRVDSDLPGSAAIRVAIDEGWIVMRDPASADVARVLALELDAGEAAAIALAIELRYEYILLDERDARAKAGALGLKPVGVLGVLLRAKREGAPLSMREMIGKLRSDAGFFVRDELERALVREAGEE